MRAKFLNFKSHSDIDKKLKTYKKDLNDKFKNKINNLNKLILNQDKFNSLISQIISDMHLDENLDENQVREDENNKDNKESKIK